MDEPISRTKPAPAPAAPGEDARKASVKRPRHRVLLVLFLLIVGLAGYIAFERFENAQRSGGSHRGAPPQSIRTAPAVTGDMPITLDGLGTVTALASAAVQTQIAGQLQKIGFTEGKMVKPGDFLAEIDSRPYQAALEQAQATFNKDTATLAQARADLARYVILAKQDSISKQQVQDQQFLVLQDQAAVAVDQANIDTAKLNLAYCRIVSPIAGLAGLLQVTIGNYLQPASATPIVTITQLEPISVVFAIPEQNLPEVRARMKAGAELPVTALDQSNSQKLATGVLAATDSQISTTTGTVNLKASFANSDDLLFPNQFVNVQLLVNTLKGATLVPNPAIQRGAPGTFVYLFNKNNTVSVQKVQIGPTDSNNTVVTSGLSPGQSVVIDGTDRLSDGVKVVVRNTSQPSPGAAAPAKPRAQHGRRQNGGGGAGGGNAQ